jgi:hypothetical protein
MGKLRPLWRCPKCRQTFVTRNIWHSCRKYDLKDLFARSEPHVYRLFCKFARMLRACGPVNVLPHKANIAFQVRVRFGGCSPRKSYLLCSLALPTVQKHPRFTKITSYSPHFHGHFFRIDSEQQLDATVQRWMRKAYEVGAQKWLEKS